MGTDSIFNEPDLRLPMSDPKVGNVEFRCEGRMLTMSCDTRHAGIYYTLDGTEPTRMSDRYMSPFRVKPRKTVKAFAVKEDYIDSDVTSFTVPGGNPVIDFIRIHWLWIAALAVVAIIAAVLYKSLSGLQSLLSEPDVQTEQAISVEPLSDGALYPVLDGKGWIVKEMDGERVVAGQVNAEIRMSDSDQTNTGCRMAVVGDYESQFRQITFAYNRQTGRLISPQLGEGHVEIVNGIVKLRIFFEGWIIEK